jgi:hypothetical protein
VTLARRVCLVLALSVYAAMLCAQTHDVPVEVWDRPRTASAILGQESIKHAVAILLAQPDARLVIHHAGAQEPELQAEELRSWLGALAIDNRRIALRGDLATGAPVRMEVIP